MRTCRYLTVSVEAVLEEMAACGLIPEVAGLSPMEASSLAHAEAQFIAKRVAMLALTDGRNLQLEVSMASQSSTKSWIAALHSAGYTADVIFAEISIGIGTARRRRAPPRAGRTAPRGGSRWPVHSRRSHSRARRHL
jgi:Zeta toxin